MWKREEGTLVVGMIVRFCVGSGGVLPEVYYPPLSSKRVRYSLTGTFTDAGLVYGPSAGMMYGMTPVSVLPGNEGSFAIKRFSRGILEVLSPLPSSPVSPAVRAPWEAPAHSSRASVKDFTLEGGSGLLPDCQRVSFQVCRTCTALPFSSSFMFFESSSIRPTASGTVGDRVEAIETTASAAIDEEDMEDTPGMNRSLPPSKLSMAAGGVVIIGRIEHFQRVYTVCGYSMS